MDGLPQRSHAAAAGREARVLTWNINGLKKVAASHGGLKDLLDQFNADIGANISLEICSRSNRARDHCASWCRTRAVVLVSVW